MGIGFSLSLSDCGCGGSVGDLCRGGSRNS